MDRWVDWLRSNGVALKGPIEHDGLCYSIYFHDPNGIRLEITTPTDPLWNRHTEKAKADLAFWSAAKKKAADEGLDVATTLVKLINEQRQAALAASRSPRT